jgi:hypothetical protein
MSVHPSRPHDPQEGRSAPLGAEQVSPIVAHLRAHWQSPEGYLTRKFAEHDVVLVAEMHGIRHNLELIQNLIPRLYEAGIYNVGMEFGAVEDQEQLDALVQHADTYDEDLARRLMFNYNVGWAYREYMDVYRRAWQLNRSLPPDAPRFRVVNLSYKYDWRHLRGPRTPYTMRKVFPRGDTERFRAGVVQREILDRGQKILVITGTIHAFTKYRMPEYDYYSPDFVMLRDVTFGNQLEQIAPGRNFTILLHIPWDSKDSTHLVRPLGGIIDEAMEAFGDKRVGFDTKGSPFESIHDSSSFYATGYPDFTLATIADGYIFEKPFRDYQGCTVDEQFLTEQNWPAAQEQIPDPDWGGRPATRDDYMQRIRDYVDMDRRLKGVR